MDSSTQVDSSTFNSEVFSTTFNPEVQSTTFNPEVNASTFIPEVAPFKRRATDQRWNRARTSLVDIAYLRITPNTVLLGRSSFYGIGVRRWRARIDPKVRLCFPQGATQAHGLICAAQLSTPKWILRLSALGHPINAGTRKIRWATQISP